MVGIVFLMLEDKGGRFILSSWTFGHKKKFLETELNSSLFAFFITEVPAQVLFKGSG